MTYDNLTLSELERLAYMEQNLLALAILKKVEEELKQELSPFKPDSKGKRK